MIIIETMQQKIFHGELSVKGMADALEAKFHRGNLQVQQIANDGQIIVQIATSQMRVSGGRTALSVLLQPVEDGVSVTIGKQNLLGVMASLGITAIATLRNPFNILKRLDDVAQDIESINLTEEVWKVLEEVARASGSVHELSERLKRLSCPYCDTANLVGQAACTACGAPLGSNQPVTCLHCGFVISSNDTTCPNCKRNLT